MNEFFWRHLEPGVRVYSVEQKWGVPAQQVYERVIAEVGSDPEAINTTLKRWEKYGVGVKPN